MGSLLTLPEFTAVAAAAVEASGAAPANGQAKAVPAARMVRYYTARGLLPRPGTRGRALVYGRRHLFCLVAVKRLQGAGLSLEEIRTRLDGLTSSELEELAAIPARSIPADLDEIPTTPGPARRSARFWDRAGSGEAESTAAPVGEAAMSPRARPRLKSSLADLARAPEAPAGPAPEMSVRSPEVLAGPAPEVLAGPAPAATPLLAVRLSDTVTVLVDASGGPLPPLSQLQRAARPLLDLLSSDVSRPPSPGAARSRPPSGAARSRKDSQ